MSNESGIRKQALTCNAGVDETVKLPPKKIDKGPNEVARVKKRYKKKYQQRDRVRERKRKREV